MIPLIQNLISFFKVERRRYKRIPCNIKAHFFIAGDRRQHRGDALITDINLHGFCCDEFHFFHEDKELRLKRNSKINIYFSLPQEDGTFYNFQIIGKIKTFLQKDSHGYAQRVGIQIQSIPRKDKKYFDECVANLHKSSETKP